MKEEPSADVEYMDQNTKRIIIIDGMVNIVHKDPDMKTWKVNTFNFARKRQNSSLFY